VRDDGRRGRAEAAAAAAVAAKPREEAGVVDIADAAAATLLARDATTTPLLLLLLLRRAAAEAVPAPEAPIAIAARIAVGAVLRDAKREPEKERGDEEREGGIAGEQRKKTKF